MVESYTLVDGTEVFVLPRGGYLFPQVLTRVDADALSRLENCAARWPFENSEVHTELKASIAENTYNAHWLACETAFFYSLPPVSAAYALPKDLRTQGFRKYGSNGIFHQWVAEQFPAEERIVSVCLNDTLNTAALVNRRAVDTSGGYSLLESIPGRSTCGSIDPSIVLLLAENGFSTAQVEKLLYLDSGWQATAGVQCSLADLVRSSDNALSLAYEILTQNLLKAIGAMLASLGGADRIVIGGGEVGESAEFITLLRSRLSFTGVPATMLEAKRKTIAENIIHREIDV